LSFPSVFPERPGAALVAQVSAAVCAAET